MSDPSKKAAASIPAWQKSGPTVVSQHNNANKDDTSPTEATITGKIQIDQPQEIKTASPEQQTSSTGSEPEATVAQVQKFLNEAAVKSAPLEKKRAFLESKGISKDIIDGALAGSDVEQSTNKQPQVVFDSQEFKTSYRQNQPQSQVQRDAPPIVTYPEFLVQPQKPPPLVTVDRLLNTAYAAGVVGLVTYGLSKYIIAPMTETLTDRRHEFADRVQENLTEFNGRLEEIVSTPIVTKTKLSDKKQGDSDTDSEASDPTELFHRDFGTQTLPEFSSPPIFPGRPIDGEEAKSTKSQAEKHEERLKIIDSHLHEMLAGTSTNQTSEKGLQDSVTDLRDYLESMLYMPPSQLENGIWTMAPDHDRKKNDAIAAFKAEIRGVKGVLLSAKRFPASSGAAAARVGG